MSNDSMDALVGITMLAIFLLTAIGLALGIL